MFSFRINLFIFKIVTKKYLCLKNVLSSYLHWLFSFSLIKSKLLFKIFFLLFIQSYFISIIFDVRIYCQIFGEWRRKVLMVWKKFIYLFWLFIMFLIRIISFEAWTLQGIFKVIFELYNSLIWKPPQDLTWLKMTYTWPVAKSLEPSSNFAISNCLFFRVAYSYLFSYCFYQPSNGRWRGKSPSIQ